LIVTPAKAGIRGQEGTTLLVEIPAFAGMTGWTIHNLVGGVTAFCCAFPPKTAKAKEQKRPGDA